ncbi:uncharacterized protein [Engystomops pustulosus]|uniref:uncharacterized protein isoform X2 n=1 Tax=Engystomops pustulosus TaxID=76066 RepID=UPI003AFB4BE0
MSSRSKGGNSDKYGLRSGSKGDFSGLLRPPIKDPTQGKKDPAVEQNKENRQTRRTTKRVTPESEDDSDGSDYSNSSGKEASENDQQSQTGNTKSQTPQPKGYSKYTKGDEETRYRRSEIRTSTDDERTTSDYREERQGEPTLYKEKRETWRTTNHEAGSSLYHRYQTLKEDIKPQPVQRGARDGFSEEDDNKDKEVTQYHRQKTSRTGLGKVEKINPSKKEKQGTCIKYLVLALVLFAGSAVAALLYMFPDTFQKVIADQLKLLGKQQQVKKDLKADFENLSSIFTNQSPQMWQRSRRILERHLENWKGNAEPAIILLTGALDAEQTLRCLGTQLADIYSSSLNGSYLLISGSDWASESNAKVKAHIDEKLDTGFRGTTQAAVLHRLELLPAGSLLILYKYCDHQSAVYKDVMLLLTVLLEEETLEKEIPLTDLEEKVRAFLIDKLTDSNAKSTHDGMDKDKFSGVWSRISHVVLPVYPDKNTGTCKLASDA